MLRFKSIADQYKLQIRGIHGEHSESDSGVYDISNRQRMGIGERSLVQNMYKGVQAMIAVEKELHKQAQGTETEQKLALLMTKVNDDTRLRELESALRFHKLLSWFAIFALFILLMVVDLAVLREQVHE